MVISLDKILICIPEIPGWSQALSLILKYIKHMSVYWKPITWNVSRINSQNVVYINTPHKIDRVQQNIVTNHYGTIECLGSALRHQRTLGSVFKVA
jgi:hypothetical protein